MVSITSVQETADKINANTDEQTDSDIKNHTITEGFLDAVIVAGADILCHKDNDETVYNQTCDCGCGTYRGNCA